jgi:hypothetical protein
VITVVIIIIDFLYKEACAPLFFIHFRTVAFISAKFGMMVGDVHEVVS